MGFNMNRREAVAENRDENLSTDILQDNPASLNQQQFPDQSIPVEKIIGTFLTPQDQQDETYIAFDDVGAGDAYAINPVPAITGYQIYQSFVFTAATANTGPATLNVNGFGAIAIKKNGTQDLVTGDIVAGQIVRVVFDGTFFQANGSTFIPSITQVLFELGEDINADEPVTLSRYVTGGPSQAVLHDTYIDEATPATNYDGADPLLLREVGGGAEKRPLFKFDFASLPDFFYLLDFGFFFDLTVAAASGSITAYAVTSAFTSSTVTWATQPTNGFPESLGSVTAVGTGAKTISITEAILNRYQQRNNVINNGIILIATGTGGLPTLNIAGALASFAVSIRYISRDGKLYKATALSGQTCVEFLGFVNSDGVTGDFKSINGNGSIITTSGLTSGKDYFIADTAGTISTNPGTQSRRIGKALTTTQLFVDLSDYADLGFVAGNSGSSILVDTPPRTSYVVCEAEMGATTGASKEKNETHLLRYGHLSGTMAATGSSAANPSTSVTLSGSTVNISYSSTLGTPTSILYFYGK